MKNFITAIVFALSLGLATSAIAAEQSVTLKVKGWSCGSCSAKTAKTLQALEGVDTAEANLEAGTIEVSFDDEKISMEKLKSAVKDAGFEAS